MSEHCRCPWCEKAPGEDHPLHCGTCEGDWCEAHGISSCNCGLQARHNLKASEKFDVEGCIEWLRAANADPDNLTLAEYQLCAANHLERLNARLAKAVKIIETFVKLKDIQDRLDIVKAREQKALNDVLNRGEWRS